MSGLILGYDYIDYKKISGQSLKNKASLQLHFHATLSIYRVHIKCTKNSDRVWNKFKA